MIYQCMWGVIGKTTKIFYLKSLGKNLKQNLNANFWTIFKIQILGGRECKQCQKVGDIPMSAGSYGENYEEN